MSWTESASVAALNGRHDCNPIVRPNDVVAPDKIHSDADKNAGVPFLKLGEALVKVRKQVGGSRAVGKIER